MNWIILHSVRPPFWNQFFSTHLDATVQAVAVKAITPGLLVSQGMITCVWITVTGDTSETRDVKF